jgi:hypothetical protein
MKLLDKTACCRRQCRQFSPQIDRRQIGNPSRGRAVHLRVRIRWFRFYNVERKHRGMILAAGRAVDRQQRRAIFRHGGDCESQIARNFASPFAKEEMPITFSG